MRKFSKRFESTVVSELNVTPLIDLAFTLLIIFMITTPLMEQSLQVSLPDSKPQGAPSSSPTTVKQVTIDAAGNVHLEKQLISLTELEIALTQLKADDPSAAVALRADKELKYQQLIDVLDVIKRAQVRLGLTTQPSSR